MIKLTPQEAWQRIAATSTKRKAKGKPTIPEVTEIGGNIYVFAQDGNAVVTTSYEDLPAVIGESENADTIPPAMMEFLDAMADEVSKAEAKEQQPTSAKAPRKAAAKATTRKTIQPLVLSKWAQGEPFNDKISLNGKKWLTGCNATALAQILYYWGCQDHNGKKYHRGCTAVKAYTTETSKFKVEALPPITVFDYAHLTADKPKTKAEKAAVSTLLEYCSKSIQSDYKQGATSASASDVAKVLQSHFRIKANWKYPKGQSTAWLEDTIYSSLKQGYPCILGGKNKGSHAFICDGYNADTGKFHFNWGWGGSYDGWYYITALTPSSSDYSSLHALIVGIHPEYILGDVNGDGDVSVQDLSESVKVVMSGEYNEKADVNSDGKVDVNDVQTIANHITGKEQL